MACVVKQPAGFFNVSLVFLRILFLMLCELNVIIKQKQ